MELHGKSIIGNLSNSAENLGPRSVVGDSDLLFAGAASVFADAQVAG